MGEKCHGYSEFPQIEWNIDWNFERNSQVSEDNFMMNVNVACSQGCIELMRAHTSGCCEAYGIKKLNSVYCKFFPNGKIVQNNPKINCPNCPKTKAVVCTSGRFTNIIINLPSKIFYIVIYYLLN